MKIGLMGGTFDPIHKGHLHIAEAAAEEYGLDEIWFLPAGDPYFKVGRDITPAKQRLEMTACCIAPYAPRYACCAIEVERSGATYTAETLSELHRRYPMHQFYFIIGLDSLYQLEKWHTPELLFEHAILLCADRPEEQNGGAFVTAGRKSAQTDVMHASGSGEALRTPAEEIAHLQKKYGTQCRIYMLKTQPMQVSSSMIRRITREGGDISAYVSEPVAAYITSHHLYA